MANALPVGVATIDEINNWSGSGNVIGIAAQGDGVHSPVGMAGAIDGSLPENNGSSVESAPSVYENSVGKGYQGPGIMGNDDGGAGSKRYKNDPNDGARPKHYTIGRRSCGDDETNVDDVTLVKTRMDSNDQLRLLKTASDEEEHDVGDNTRIAGLRPFVDKSASSSSKKKSSVASAVP